MVGSVTRRAFIVGLPAAGVMCPTGCKSIPGESVVSIAARGIGCAVGIVINECNLSQDAREAVMLLMRRIVAVTPGCGETLTVTWVTAAKQHVDRLVDEGKVSPIVGAIALAAFAVVVQGYVIVETRYPHVKIVRVLTCAAVDGFAAGVLMALERGPSTSQSYDVEAYRVLAASPDVVVLKNLVHVVAQGGYRGYTVYRR